VDRTRLRALLAIPAALALALPAPAGTQSAAWTVSTNAIGEAGRAAVPLQSRQPNLATGALGIDWAMPPRLLPAHSTYGDNDGLPPEPFVNPRSWKVDLFLTDHGKRDCPSGASFDWTVSGDGSSETPRSHACSVTAQVPSLGTYSVTARELRHGEPTGTEVTDHDVLVKDWLIVGLGDSNGSGQGNPPYINTRCDRSEASYQYQTALYIEDHDPRTSVTFVFDACSGARSDQVWKDSYLGQQPSGGVVLAPQIDQVESVIGRRRPDAVIISAGVNDLSFGPVMAFCATYTGPQGSPKDCQDAPVVATSSQGYVEAYSLARTGQGATVAQRTAAQLKVLPRRLEQLSKALDGLHAAHVFATQYPDESTGQDGALCNKTGPFPQLPSGVWGWLQQVGDKLNAMIAGGTGVPGWIPVTGVAKGFKGHGYCSPSSYFVTPLASVLEQGNTDGSFHADAKGNQVTLALTRDSVCQQLYGNPECNGDPPAPK
jgi:lysophospholipase L1-like esterase